MAQLNPVQLQKHLKGVDYPARKQDLINHVRQKGADEAAISALEKLPDREFKNPIEVSQAIADLK
ncbi:DUF2795 domain-containing protein [Microseira wollei]|uniref:DUF2795 domain-containing protein n=1 Tax=Microseira wollei NIES-4236 TaxID=2530354 RepID=A0AAV3XLJ0_9CYAN|nr:DUF2795 domain-containing protein [Microseira wollei]GET40392.1 hypothetical protein MiSe_52010 [Microseira wollei NIES-4236]